eukprot:969708-Rhodomonas_salina.1
MDTRLWLVQSSDVESDCQLAGGRPTIRTLEGALAADALRSDVMILTRILSQSAMLYQGATGTLANLKAPLRLR